MLIKPLPGHQEAFLDNLAGMSILLIGAGGAARAVAVFLADAIGSEGRVFICNRTEEKALELIGVLTESGTRAEYVDELDIAEVVEGIDIIVNSTTKGQSGLRIMGEGSVTSLEPYSALGPASPAVIPEPEMEGTSSAKSSIFQLSHSDILRNFEFSSKILTAVPASTCFVDLIYSPLETPMLAQARASGHLTLNGRGMNIAQAADAFVYKALIQHLTDSGFDLEEAYQRVFRTMESIW
jgi:shikimate 5-dehydrogenase